MIELCLWLPKVFTIYKYITLIELKNIEWFETNEASKSNKNISLFATILDKAYEEMQGKFSKQFFISMIIFCCNICFSIVIQPCFGQQN